jgi:hypothetical protein
MPRPAIKIVAIVKPGICVLNCHLNFKYRISGLYHKKIPLLKLRGVNMIACQKKFFIKSENPSATKLKVANYLATAGESTTGAATAGESTTGAAGAGVSTAGESTFGASVSEALLQAAKDTDTIANAKITFFILCFV